MNHELPDFQAGFRKGRGTRNQTANIHWIIKKVRQFQRNIYFCFIDYAKAFDYVQLTSVQWLRCVWLFVTPWTATCQASLSNTNSWSLAKLMSIESVMPSNHLILCHPLLLLPSVFPSIRVFSNESALCIRWPNTGASASTSVLPMKIQDWSALAWTGWISLQSKGLSKDFSKTTVQKH